MGLKKQETSMKLKKRALHEVPGISSQQGPLSHTLKSSQQGASGYTSKSSQQGPSGHTMNIILTVIFILTSIYNLELFPVNARIPDMNNLRASMVSTPTPSGVIEITSTDIIAELTETLKTRENFALNKEVEQSSTGYGKDFELVNEGQGNCGCPLTCSREVLSGNNGLQHACEARIAYFIGRHDRSHSDGCKGASENVPTACGKGTECHPEKCPKPDPAYYFLGKAENAVDGNTDQSYSQASVSTTKTEVDPWWWVKLGAFYEIEKIIIYNRMDDRSDYLTQFHVEVLKQDVDGVLQVVDGVYSEDKAGSVALVSFKNGSRGSVVRIRLEGFTKLNLAEVKVYGRVIG